MLAQAGNVRLQQRTSSKIFSRPPLEMMTNMGPTPIRARAAEQALVGVAVEPDAVAAALTSIADGTAPPTDLNGDPEYRRHLVSVLGRRAVLAAART